MPKTSEKKTTNNFTVILYNFFFHQMLWEKVWKRILSEKKRGTFGQIYDYNYLVLIPFALITHSVRLKDIFTLISIDA